MWMSWACVHDCLFDYFAFVSGTTVQIDCNGMPGSLPQAGMALMKHAHLAVNQTCRLKGTAAPLLPTTGMVVTSINRGFIVPSRRRPCRWASAAGRAHQAHTGSNCRPHSGAMIAPTPAAQAGATPMADRAWAYALQGGMRQAPVYRAWHGWRAWHGVARHGMAPWQACRHDGMPFHSLITVAPGAGPRGESSAARGGREAGSLQAGMRDHAACGMANRPHAAAGASHARTNACAPAGRRCPGCAAAPWAGRWRPASRLASLKAGTGHGAVGRAALAGMAVRHGGEEACRCLAGTNMAAALGTDDAPRWSLRALSSALQVVVMLSAREEQSVAAPGCPAAPAPPAAPPAADPSGC